MSSCGLGPPYQLGQCGARGTCVFDAYFNRSACVCAAGYDSISDFQASNQLIDCSISIEAIRALWVLNLLLTLFVFARSLPIFSRVLSAHRAKASKARFAGRQYTIIMDNKRFLSVLPFICIGLPSQIIFALLKIALPSSQHIGAQWVPTMLWWVVRLTFYFGQTVYQRTVLESLLRGSKMTIDASLYSSHWSIVFTATTQLIVIWPILFVVDPFNPTPGLVTSAVFFCTSCLNYLMMALQSMYVKFMVTRVLDKSLELVPHQRSQALRDQLVDGQNQFATQCMTLAIMYGFFAVWPLLWSKHDYLLPVNWSLAVYSFLVVMRSLDQPNISAVKNTDDHPSEFQTVGFLAESALNGICVKVSVIRQGSVHESDAIGIEHVLREGKVFLDDGDGVVHVQSNRTRVFRSSDTLLGAIAPVANARALRALKQWVAKGHLAVYLPLTTFTVACLVLASIIMINTVIPTPLAIFFAAVAVFYFGAGLCLINFGVTKLVVRTAFFWTRLTSALVSTVCLSVVLSDERICIVLALFSLQVFVAASDAASGELAIFRIVLLAQLIACDLVMLAGLFFDLIPTSFASVVISSSFDYALAQLARDLLLGTLLVAVFDFAFALRGANRRFATIFEKIKVVMHSFEDDPIAEGGQRIIRTPKAKNVSEMQMKSGFLVDEQASLNPSRVTVYVDLICLRQRDAIVCHVLGPSKGERVFRLLDGRGGEILDLQVVLLLFASGAAPWIPFLSLAAVPFVLVFTARRILLSSWAMIKLIVQRRQFQVSLTFILIYCAVWTAVFLNVQALYAVMFLVTSVCELLKDASLRHRSRQTLVQNKVLLGLYALFVTACLIWNVYGDQATHFYVDFRPDTSDYRRFNSSVSYSDGVAVVDVYQQAADLGLSLGVGHVLNGLIIWLSYQPDELTTIHLPIVPVFEDGDPQIS